MKLKTVKKIGSGSFGKTYLVIDVDTDTYYILKQPRPLIEAQHQAHQEAKILKHIREKCKPYLVCVC